MTRMTVAAAFAVAVPLLTLTQTTDEAKRNQDVIRQHLERLNRGDVKAAALDFAEDTKNFGRPVGREGILRVLEDIYTTFPDWRMEVVEMIAEGDSVVVRCTASGTHRGIGRRAVNGGMLLGVEPTGKRFEVQHIHWYKLRDGKIVEHFATRDDIGMMRQLGLLPPVGLPTAK
ncbi:MAG: ester cyclase [Candidatus Acidiferrales bacterium]